MDINKTNPEFERVSHVDSNVGDDCMDRLPEEVRLGVDGPKAIGALIQSLFPGAANVEGTPEAVIADTDIVVD